MSASKIIDMSGKICGNWTVLSFGGLSKHGMALWLCRCKCGRERKVNGTNLRAGRSTGCGCGTNAWKSGKRNAERRDFTGQRFGRLLVVGENGHVGKYIGWLCRCDCGNEVTLRANVFAPHPLKPQVWHTRSCGCLLRDWRSSGIDISQIGKIESAEMEVKRG
jgi:hypothetical protein